MYLYIYEDGHRCQSPLPPTELDLQGAKSQYLLIITFDSGKFQHYVPSANTWQNIPAGERREDPEFANQEYTDLPRL